MKLSTLHTRPTTEVLDCLTFNVFYEETKEQNEEERAIERFQQIWQDIRKQGGTKEIQLEKLVDALDDACENRSVDTNEILSDDEGEDGYCSMPGGAGAAVFCTASAKFLQKIVGGKVMGYRMQDNPGTSLEYLSDGHDFLLVDNRYIVDFWVKKIEGVSERAVMDLQRHSDKKLARSMYGMKSKWSLVEGVLQEQVELDVEEEDDDPNWEEKAYKWMPDDYKRERRLRRKMRQADQRHREKRRARMRKDLGAIKGERLSLSEPKIVYHGTTADKVKQIMADGFLTSDEVEKSSAGTLEEKGLIWFATSKQHASGYAKGQERREGPKHGGIFAITLPAGTKLIDRYAKLTEREAAILDKGNKRRSYDPIRAGVSLSSAMHKLYQHPQSIRTYGEILPLLGYDGIHHGDGFQIGMAKKKFPITSFDVIE